MEEKGGGGEGGQEAIVLRNVDGAHLCKSSVKKGGCRRRPLRGYEYCNLHILEDETAGFVPCEYVAVGRSVPCGHAARPESEERGKRPRQALCTHHRGVEAAEAAAAVHSVRKRAAAGSTVLSPVMLASSAAATDPAALAEAAAVAASELESSLLAGNHCNSERFQSILRDLGIPMRTLARQTLQDTESADSEAAVPATKDVVRGQTLSELWLDRILHSGVALADQPTMGPSSSGLLVGYVPKGAVSLKELFGLDDTDLTADDISEVRRNQLTRLIELYRTQYLRLMDVVRVRYDRYLSARAAIEASRRRLHGDGGDEESAAIVGQCEGAGKLTAHLAEVARRALTAWDSYDSQVQAHYSELQKNAARLLDRRPKPVGDGHRADISIACAVPRCRGSRLVPSEFCYAHILRDPRQVLFVPCEYDVPKPSGPPAKCGFPVLRYQSHLYCMMHIEDVLHSKKLAEEHSKDLADGVPVLDVEDVEDASLPIATASP